MLLDFGAVIVHVFAPEEREFYGLERLWGKAARSSASSEPGTQPGVLRAPGAWPIGPIERSVPRFACSAHDRPNASFTTDRDLPLLQRPALTSVFDTVFRDPEAEERLFFAIPGALCVPCRQLYVDQQLIGILGLDGARCTFAIESDRVLQTGQAGAA